MTDERWTKPIMSWRSPTARPRGRKPDRWTNRIKRTAGTDYQQIVIDRSKLLMREVSRPHGAEFL